MNAEISETVKVRKLRFGMYIVELLGQLLSRVLRPHFGRF